MEEKSSEEKPQQADVGFLSRKHNKFKGPKKVDSEYGDNITASELLRMPELSEDEERELYGEDYDLYNGKSVEHTEWVFTAEELADDEPLTDDYMMCRGKYGGRYHDSKYDSDGDIEHICAYCYDRYPTAKELENHNKTKCVEEYRCKLCRKIFLRKEDIDYHINRKKSCIASKDDIYKCKYCKKAYSSDGNMRRHMRTCKSKESKKEPEVNPKKDAVKVHKIDSIIEEYNNRDNKTLLNFDLSEPSIKSLRARFDSKDLDKISDWLYKGECGKLAEFIIRKMHYSDDYSKGRNIKYLEEINKYIVYDKTWKNKSSESVSIILQKEVEFVAYLATSASDIPSNKAYVNVLFENKKLLDEDNYKKTQFDVIKEVQKKYEEHKN